MSKSPLIWDLPTRLFHWMLVFGLLAQWFTAEWFEDALTIHMWLGYGLLSLCLFRVAWGFFGPKYARFSHNIPSPKDTVDYLSGKTNEHYVGHNPIGAWFLPCVLILVFTQGVSGFFVTDDVFFNGPYYEVIGEDLRSVMIWLHHNAINGVWALIVLHLCALVWHQWQKKEPLMQSMVTGKKSHLAHKYTIHSHHFLRALLILILSMLIIGGVVWMAPEPEPFYF